MTSHYEFDIKHATTPGELHALVDNITHDTSLSPEERMELTDKVSDKFCQWNARPDGSEPVKGRWD